MKSLALYQQQVAALKKKRMEVDEDIIQVVAEALTDGYSFIDVFDGKPDANQQVFDL